MLRRALGLAAILLIAANTTTFAEESANSTISIHIADMHCQHCAKKISGKLYTVKGVKNVKTMLEDGLAEVTPSKQQMPSLKTLWEVLEEADFEPTKIVVGDKVYDKKPAA